MSRKTTADYVGTARDRARQAATQLGPVTEQVKPLAKSTSKAAKRGLHKTREWAAPQVERTGQVLTDSVAPKVSAMLSAAAKRIDPNRPARGRWRKPLGVVATVTAAASAAAAYLRTRMKSQGTSTGTSAHSMTSTNGQAPVDASSNVSERSSTS
jgi:hypothetical protein